MGHLPCQEEPGGAALGLLIHSLIFPKLSLLGMVMINQAPHLGP